MNLINTIIYLVFALLKLNRKLRLLSSIKRWLWLILKLRYFWVKTMFWMPNIAYY